MIGKKAAAFALLLMVMAVIPAAVVGVSQKQLPQTPAVQTPAEASCRPEEVVRFAASLCGGDFCEEAVRAMVILANTDCGAQPPGDNDSSKEIYDRVQRLYDSNSELYIRKNGAVSPVPFAWISNGQTCADSGAPSLCAVASPWDCLDAAYDPTVRCAGVSLRGVNYLCQQGYSAEEALLHYLPGYEINA